MKLADVKKEKKGDGGVTAAPVTTEEKQTKHAFFVRDWLIRCFSIILRFSIYHQLSQHLKASADGTEQKDADQSLLSSCLSMEE